MTKAITGRCLCGAIQYSSTGEPMMMGHCHCEDCRRSSGSGHSSHLAVPESGVSMTGVPKGYARPADSGHMVTRYFCSACGSALYSTNDAMPGMMFIRASSLDDLEVFKPQMHVYASRAASWDRPGADVQVFEIMPPGM
jgi:hypothetical protein